MDLTQGTDVRGAQIHLRLLFDAKKGGAVYSTTELGILLSTMNLLTLTESTRRTSSAGWSRCARLGVVVVQ